MESLFRMAALLVVVAGSSASDDLCSIRLENELDCSGRGLLTLPPGFWPQITHLVLRNNAINKLSKTSFSGFPFVETLEMKNNSLTEMDFGILTPMTNFSFLSIENNQIETFTSPADGTILKHFSRIFASNNRVSKLDPDFFSFAPNLELLDLEDNPLLVVAGRPALNHPNLVSLTMTFGGTSFIAVDSTLLAGLPKLRIVRLPFSNINSVEGAFFNNKHIKDIYLEGNAINQITPGTFAEERRIQTLFLERNPLFRVDIAALNDSMAPGGEIYINKTPLACECGFEVLYKWAKTRDITIEATCSVNHKCLFTIQSPTAQPP